MVTFKDLMCKKSTKLPIKIKNFLGKAFLLLK